MAEYIEREAVNALIKAECSPKVAAYLIDAVATIHAAAVRPVVTCAECKWWTKQEASLQGRCELLQMYPTGAWFCANGKREES